MNLRRRLLLRALPAGFAMTPVAALLAACGNADDPNGPVRIRWDRDTCRRCNMAISDRRFAAQLRGGEKNESIKFDDIGCAVFWLRDHWAPEIAAAARIWVADSSRKANDEAHWLDARQAQYVSGRVSPMGYNFAAVDAPQAGSIDYESMKRQILARGK